MKDREAKISARAKPRLTEALERLVQLYNPGAPGGQARPGGQVAGEVGGKQEDEMTPTP